MDVIAKGEQWTDKDFGHDPKGIGGIDSQRFAGYTWSRAGSMLPHATIFPEDLSKMTPDTIL